MEYESFAAQAKSMRDELVRSATTEADNWLASTLAMLSRLPRSSATTEAGAVGVGKVVVSTPEPHIRESLGVLTRRAIEAMPAATFTSLDVRKALEPHYPMGPTQRANLANLLKRLDKNGEIQLVRRGSGSTPSTFRKNTT